MPPYLFPESVWYVQGIHHARAGNSPPPSRSLDIFTHYRPSALMRSVERLYRDEELNPGSLIDYSSRRQIASSAHPRARTPLSILYSYAPPHETVSHRPTASVISHMPSMTIQDVTYTHCHCSMTAPYINTTKHTHTEHNEGKAPSLIPRFIHSVSI